MLARGSKIRAPRYLEDELRKSGRTIHFELSISISLFKCFVNIFHCRMIYPQLNVDEELEFMHVILKLSTLPLSAPERFVPIFG
jgi:hypothetical protein